MTETKTNEIDLRTLKLLIHSQDEIEIENQGEKLYDQEFLKGKLKGFAVLHDGDKIVFDKERFRHAFFQSPRKDRILKERVERIKWILPMVQKRAKSIDCWELTQENGLKRMYACFGLGYVIWLVPGEKVGDWLFSTAYPASRAEIRKYIANAVQKTRK